MRANTTSPETQKLLKEKSGIRLDIGSGASKQGPDWVGIDILPLKGVDIVHNIEITPWPLPDNCVSTAIASHLLEHINPSGGDARLARLVDLLVDKKIIKEDDAKTYMGEPGPVFIRVMNEIWRVLKPGGQFAFVVPYAESFGQYQDPTHVNFINEATMNYFDPLHPSGYYQFYHPKPWKVIKQPFSRTGVLECLLEKRPMDRSYLGDGNPSDLTKEDFSVQTIRNDY
jgi:predicted SAM-dependent methyltransferase